MRTPKATDRYTPATEVPKIPESEARNFVADPVMWEKYPHICAGLARDLSTKKYPDRRTYNIKWNSNF